MKLIKKYAGLLLMLTLLVGFTSCEDDEDLEERMFGRVWVGDVGMSAGNGRILYSEFTFDPDGFGEEYQFFRNGQNFRTYTKMHRKNSEMLILRRFMYPVEKQLILEVIRQAFFPEKLRKHLPQESGRSFPVHSMFRRPRIRL